MPRTVKERRSQAVIHFTASDIIGANCQRHYEPNEHQNGPSNKWCPCGSYAQKYDSVTNELQKAILQMQELYEQTL